MLTKEKYSHETIQLETAAKKLFTIQKIQYIFSFEKKNVLRLLFCLVMCVATAVRVLASTATNS